MDSEELDLGEIDRAIHAAVGEVKEKRIAKYKRLIEVAQASSGAAAKLEKQKRTLEGTRQELVQRLNVIDKHTDKQVREALGTVRRAVLGNIEGIDKKVIELNTELEKVHRENTDKHEAILKLKDRAEFLFSRNGYKPTYPETLQPKTYLPECRPEIRRTWDRIVAFASGRPDAEVKDECYLNRIYNAAAAEVRMAGLLADLEIDELYVLEKLTEQLGNWAKASGITPEALNPEFAPPGNDWLLYQQNETAMAEGRKLQLDEEAVKKASQPLAPEVEVDPFLEKLIESGMADWFRKKRILFYGANSKPQTDELCRFVREELEAEVNWYEIGNSTEAAARMLRSNKAQVDLVILWEKFAPTPRQAHVVKAAKASGIPVLKVRSTNRDILFDEIAQFLGKSLKK